MSWLWGALLEMLWTVREVMSVGHLRNFCYVCYEPFIDPPPSIDPTSLKGLAGNEPIVWFVVGTELREMVHFHNSKTNLLFY